MLRDEVYDSDDPCNRSPSPKPQKITYGREDTLPPFVKRASPSGGGEGDSSSDQDTSPGPPRKRRHAEPSQGDRVLLGISAPNYLDVAQRAAQELLGSESPSEDEREPVKLKQKKTEDAGVQQATSKADLGKAAAIALSLLNSDEHQQQSYCGGSPMAIDSTEAPEQGRKEKDIPSPATVDIKKEPASPRSEQPQNFAFNSENKAADDSLSTSPLRKFVIPAPEGSPQDVLPALQSPPHSATANSPENNQNLPSIEDALGPQLKDHVGVINGVSPHSFSSIPGSSPPLPRNVLGPDCQRPGHLPHMLSPYSQGSPANSKDLSSFSPGSQPYSWRPLKPDRPFVTSPYDASAHGAQTSKSPATSYPTPTEQKVGGDPERPTFPAAAGQSNTPAPVGTYKCPHPGCTAPPFQTQYLLK